MNGNTAPRRRLFAAGRIPAKSRPQPAPVDPRAIVADLIAHRDAPTTGGAPRAA